MNIPDKAVEAAAKAHHGVMTGGGPGEWGYLDKQSQDNRLYWMRAALEAAAPYMGLYGTDAERYNQRGDYT